MFSCFMFTISRNDEMNAYDDYVCLYDDKHNIDNARIIV